MKYFAFASGEHIELARAEIESLCQMLPFETSVRWSGRLASITGNRNPADFLLSRGAFIQEAGTVLAESSSPQTLFERLPLGRLNRYLSSDRSFAVRALALHEGVSHGDRQVFERNLGRLILDATNSRVDLGNPDVLLRVFLLPERFVLCISVLSSLRAVLRKREPGKKPFFHPSMMNAFLSRVMCNLVGMKPSDVVLDPFCGGGGILCEAAFIGSRVIGVELNWKLLRGASENLSQVTHDFSLVQGNACKLPINSCDRLVTDPPYGRGSSTRGVQARELVESLVRQLDKLLIGPGEAVCICSSEEMNLLEVVDEAGHDVGRHIRIRVHSGLVREVITVII
jgi:tRNA (guanine10-N2)-dimethyltransferase